MRLSRSIVGLLIVSCFAFGLEYSSEVFAQGQGQFDGAVWKMKMHRRGAPNKELVGVFRVKDGTIYQPKDMQDKEFTQKVGYDTKVRRKQTKLVFQSMRVKMPNGKVIEGMKGTAAISIEKAGFWKGQLIDGQGRRWNFACLRVNE